MTAPVLPAGAFAGWDCTTGKRPSHGQIYINEAWVALYRPLSIRIGAQIILASERVEPLGALVVVVVDFDPLFVELSYSVSLFSSASRIASSSFDLS